MHHISFQLHVQFDEEAAVNEDEVDNDFANFENFDPDSEDVSYEIVHAPYQLPTLCVV